MRGSVSYYWVVVDLYCIVFRIDNLIESNRDWSDAKFLDCETIERHLSLIMRAMRNEKLLIFDHHREEWESSLKQIVAFFNTCKNNLIPFLCYSCRKGMLMRKGISEMVKRKHFSYCPSVVECKLNPIGQWQCSFHTSFCNFSSTFADPFFSVSVWNSRNGWEKANKLTWDAFVVERELKWTSYRQEKGFLIGSAGVKC